MIINSNFTVIASGKVYSIDNKNDLSYKDQFELTFDIEKARNFLLRFSPASFLVDEYKLVFKYDPTHKVQTICIFVDDKYMIVQNGNQLVNDIHEGYIRLMMLDKISDIMEFDFKAGIELQETQDLEDEFGLEE